MEYTNSQIKARSEEHLHSERDRAILYRRLVDGVFFEPLAEEFGMSERQVKTIVYRCEKILFSHLPNPG